MEQFLINDFGSRPRIWARYVVNLLNKLHMALGEQKMVSGSPNLDFCNHLGQRDGKKSFSKLYYELCVKLNSLNPISDNSHFGPQHIIVIFYNLKTFLVFSTSDSDSPLYLLYFSHIIMSQWETSLFTIFCTQMLPWSWNVS